MTTTEKDQAGDCPDEFVDEEEGGQESGDKIHCWPNLTSTIRKQQQITEMIAALPQPVKKRVKALKKLQLETTHIEAKFFKEVHELECKYQKLYTPLYEKREKIVNGVYEPNDEESQWPSDDEEELAKELKEKTDLNNKEKEEDKDIKGIPDFWLTIFKNCSILADMVQPHDEPILKHLLDIKSIVEVDPMVFTLEFYFSPNEYFTDKVLRKQYIMKCTPEEDDPFSFEGPEIYKCTGCPINWNKRKNVTLKTIKKKQKHTSRGVLRTVTHTEPNDSFFNFFSPPENSEDDEEVDDDLRNILTSDFEIGHYIRERIIPNAVLYFTGEGIDDEDDDYFEEEEDEEDDEDGESDGEKKIKMVPDDKNCKQQ